MGTYAHLSDKEVEADREKHAEYMREKRRLEALPIDAYMTWQERLSKVINESRGIPEPPPRHPRPADAKPRSALRSLVFGGSEAYDTHYSPTDMNPRRRFSLRGLDIKSRKRA